MARIGRRIFKPGERFEHYRIVKKLGEGGMGAVYQVYHPALDATFALKILFPDVAARDPEFVDRFVREARLSSRLRHPNLISVHDAGRDIQWGMYYLVMDFIDGGSVRQKLKQQGRMLPEDAFSVILQMLSALTEARKNGMVHRDIKPDNIMFTESGVVKLADLGIAKSTSECDATLTMESTVFGTPAYMSPEQAKDAKNVDCRADIYSLGIVFYEMLTGQCPYRGTPMAIVAKILSPAKIPDIRAVNPQIPDEIARIVMKMCEKDLSARYAAPEEVIADMSSLLDEELTADAYFAHIAQKENTAPTSRKVAQGSASTIISTRETWEKEWRRAKKRKFFFYTAAAVFAVFLLGYGIFVLIQYSARKRVETEKIKIAEQSKSLRKKVAQLENEKFSLAREKNKLIQRLRQLENEETNSVKITQLRLKQISEEKIRLKQQISALQKREDELEKQIALLKQQNVGHFVQERELAEKLKQQNAERLAREREWTARLEKEKKERAALEARLAQSRKQSADPDQIDFEQIEKDKLSGIQFSENGKTLIKFPKNDTRTEYTIPNGVVNIADEAFSRCEKLRKVIMPDSVLMVGSNAFFGCKNMIEFVFSENLMSIGSAAFQHCSSLEKVILPESIVNIPRGIFRNCSRLAEVSMRSVTKISREAFSGCKSLRVFPISNNITVIDDEAFIGSGLEYITIPAHVNVYGNPFFGCENLTAIQVQKNNRYRLYSKDGNLHRKTMKENVMICYPAGKKDTICTLPADVAYAANSFSGNPYLQKIILPETLVSIRAYMFKNCTALESVLIPSSVKEIESGAFNGCSSIKEIIVPDSVNEIGFSVFSGCKRLKTIKLSSSLTEIPDNTFFGCGFESFKIPENIKIVGRNAFARCSNLKSVDWKHNVIIEQYAFSGTPFADVTTKTSQSSGQKHNTTAVNGKVIDNVTFSMNGKVLLRFPADDPRTEYIIPNDVFAISPKAFSGCKNLEKVIIPDSIVEIDDLTFSGCKSLHTVRLPKNLKHIGLSAFSGTALQEIKIPDRVIRILEDAFSGTQIKSVTIPGSVQFLGTNPFANCKNLTEIKVVKNSDKFFAKEGILFQVDNDGHIQIHCYPAGKKDKKYILPDIEISLGAFSGCRYLKEIVLPANLKIIKRFMFMSTHSLETITIPDSVIKIEPQAFIGCRNLKNVKLPKGVIIEKGAFAGTPYGKTLQ